MEAGDVVGCTRFAAWVSGFCRETGPGHPAQWNREGAVEARAVVWNAALVELQMRAATQAILNLRTRLRNLWRE